MLPFVYAIVQSLKPTEEIFAYPPKFFVRNPTGENYKTLSQLVDSLWIPFGRYIINSAAVTVAGTGLNLLFSSMAAFAFAKYNFPGNRWMFSLIVAALLFSGTGYGAAAIHNNVGSRAYKFAFCAYNSCGGHSAWAFPYEKLYGTDTRYGY